MTREEAIHSLKAVRDSLTHVDIMQAFDMAIEALNQQPCVDCISRVEAMRAITDEWIHTYGNNTLEGFTDALYNLPPCHADTGRKARDRHEADI